jgi:hypothetical protein
MPPTRRAIKGSRLTADEFDANLDALDRLTPVILTITNGSITITGPGVYRVDPEGGASTDDLTAITGGLGHEWEVTLCLNTAGRVITVRHTPPNLKLQNGADFILNSVDDTIKLMDRTSAIWRETGRCSVP